MLKRITNFGRSKSYHEPQRFIVVMMDLIVLTNLNVKIYIFSNLVYNGLQIIYFLLKYGQI